MNIPESWAALSIEATELRETKQKTQHNREN